MRSALARAYAVSSNPARGGPLSRTFRSIRRRDAVDIGVGLGCVPIPVFLVQAEIRGAKRLGWFRR
jgi:hypothetical protein